MSDNQFRPCMAGPSNIAGIEYAKTLVGTPKVEVTVYDLDEFEFDTTGANMPMSPVNESMDVESEDQMEFGNISVTGYTSRENVAAVMKAAAHHFWHDPVAVGCTPQNCTCPYI